MATSIIKTDEIRRLNDTVMISDGVLTGNVTFPAGHVIKVTQGYTNSKVQKTSTGYIWENAASIQLTSINNKVLILLNAAFGQSNLNGGIKLHRNGSEFMPDLPSAYSGGATAYTGALSTADDSIGVSQAYGIGNQLFSYLDTPNTLNECFYSLYWYLNSGSAGSVNLNVQATDNGGTSFSTMTLMEISV